jgi:hypothetical protein
VLEPGRPQGPFLVVGLSALPLTIGFFIVFIWTERLMARGRRGDEE